MEENNMNNKPISKKEKRKKIALKVALILVVAFILFSATAVGVVLAIIKSAPSIESDIINNLPESSKVYDKDNNFLSYYYDPYAGNRTIVPLDQIPKDLQNAFISIEDERFYTHKGIDVKRIFGALWYDIKTMSNAQGGSTITQQLVKNYKLSQEKKLTRKIQEAYLAILLERKLSKERILEAYLNTIYMGGTNINGVQAASMFYFGKDVKELNIAECALLAGINQSPGKYNPYSEKNKKNPEIYLNRQKTVLKKMLELGSINEQQYQEALNTKLVFIEKKNDTGSNFQWFIEPAMDSIAKDYAEKYKCTVNEAYSKLRVGGYSIYLTMDKNIQQNGENVINNSKYYPVLKDKNMQEFSRKEGDPKIIEPQAAAVVMDVMTGEVRAIIGGRGAHPLKSINRAVDKDLFLRQPGSAIKPLGVYAPALDKGIITGATIIEDSAITDENFLKVTKNWQPKNYDGTYHGSLTVREAIKHSYNIPPIKVLMNLGTKTSYSYVTDKFHITTLSKSDINYAPLALGGLTNGVSPIEMAAAYAIFANNGMYSEPIYYAKVVDRSGNVILETKTNQSRSLPPQSAYVMTDLLKSVVRDAGGTATRANLGAMPAAGKTGTTDDNRSAWFVGYTPYYVCAVWMGHDLDNFAINRSTSNMSLLGYVCTPIWKDIMLPAHKSLTVKDFVKPSNVVTAQYCIKSGKAPSPYCGADVRSDVFIAGTEPVEICDVHLPPTPENPDGENTTTP